MSLVPGVYCADTFTLTGVLTLTGNGVWIFKSASTLITSTGQSVPTVTGGDPCNVWWRVPSSATISTDASFIGNILAVLDIQLQTRASLNGRALSQTAGAVTLDTNTITGAACFPRRPGVTPTPSGGGGGKENKRGGGGGNRAVLLPATGVDLAEERAVVYSQGMGFGLGGLALGLVLLGFVLRRREK